MNSLVIFYTFVIVNKSHKNTTTKEVLVCLSILFDFPNLPNLSVALVPKPISSY